MVNFPSSKWIQDWGIDSSNAHTLDKFIKENKPKIILETGTFEGQATYVMAQAANDNNNNCHIFTIDYDGDPTSELSIDNWLLLKSLRNDNLKKIREEFKNVTVTFIEGDSREVLKTLFTEYNINCVDLFYQDSMHFKEGIESEWNLVEPFIKKNSFTIFDDLGLKGVKQFKKWFKNKYNSTYYYSEIKEGHKQFIVQKK